jgi:hypothetical protein
LLDLLVGCSDLLLLLFHLLLDLFGLSLQTGEKMINEIPMQIRQTDFLILFQGLEKKNQY